MKFIIVVLFGSSLLNIAFIEGKETKVKKPKPKKDCFRSFENPLLVSMKFFKEDVYLVTDLLVISPVIWLLSFPPKKGCLNRTEK